MLYDMIFQNLKINKYSSRSRSDPLPAGLSSPPGFCPPKSTLLPNLSHLNTLPHNSNRLHELRYSPHHSREQASDLAAKLLHSLELDPQGTSPDPLFLAQSLDSFTGSQAGPRDVQVRHRPLTFPYSPPNKPSCITSLGSIFLLTTVEEDLGFTGGQAGCRYPR